MEQFAADLRGILAHLEVEQAHVWGTSAGGHIALAFGLRYPKAVAGLVLADSAPWLSRDPELRARLRERIDLLKAKGPEAAYAARRELGTVGINLFAASRPTQGVSERGARNGQRDRIRAQIAAIPRAERIAKYAGELRTYSAYLDFDASERIAALEPETLIVWGTRDSVFPDPGWSRLARDSTRVAAIEVDGAEHGAAGGRAEADILRFLRAHTPAR